MLYLSYSFTSPEKGEIVNNKVQAVGKGVALLSAAEIRLWWKFPTI